ncbi:hypothetical protein KCV02_g28, partial [Aureobasidium melanogenum]
MSSSLTSLTSLLHLIALDLTLSSSLITAMSSLVPPLRLASLSPSLVTSSIALAEKLSEFVLVLFGGWIGGAFGLEGFEVNLSDAGEAFLLADFFFLFLFFLVVVSVLLRAGMSTTGSSEVDFLTARSSVADCSGTGSSLAALSLP